MARIYINAEKYFSQSILITYKEIFQRCKQIISVISYFVVNVLQIKSTKHSKAKERLLGRNILNVNSFRVEISFTRPMSIFNVSIINFKYLCTCVNCVIERK